MAPRPTDEGFDEWYGIPNTTDESVYTSLPGFAESGLSQTFVMDGKRGEAPKEERPYDLDYRPRGSIAISPTERSPS